MTGRTMYDYATVGQIGGIDIVVNPRLREDDAYYFPPQQTIICGSVSAFRYKVAKAQIVLNMRADLQRQLDAFAKRVGVDRSTLSE